MKVYTCTTEKKFSVIELQSEKESFGYVGYFSINNTNSDKIEVFL